MPQYQSNMVQNMPTEYQPINLEDELMNIDQ